MTLEEAHQHVGERVVYRPKEGYPEDGKIVSVGERYVFVLYDGSYSSKATRPEDLILLEGG